MGPGGVLGRFEIIGPLGRGAAGDVFLARDPTLERTVALKTIRLDAPGVIDASDALARFRREAKITARLSHPHIVVVHEFGEEGLVLYLAMEYVPGGTLAQRLVKPEAPFPLAERTLLLAQVAEALAHAHGLDVIHRDLKPANILLATPTFAKVSDFGIGKLLGGETDLTGTGQMVGSPAYMSPEQMRGEPVEARSDVFSLGVVLYQVLTGAKPFPSTSLPMLVRRVQHEDPPDPLTVSPDLPPELAGLTLECLSKEPRRRPSAADAATRLHALVPLLTGLPASPLPLPAAAPRLFDPASVETLRAPGPAREPRTAETARLRRPAPAAVLVSTAVLGGVAVALWALLAPAGGDRSAQPPAPAAATAVSAALPTPRPAPSPTTPPPRPTATPRPRPTATPTPTPLPAGSKLVRLRARSGLKLRVDPDQARVFVDGTLAGVADDWDGRGGGALLTFAAPGRRLVRIAAAGRADLFVDLTVASDADLDVVEMKEKLLEGKPGGETGPARKLGRPDYRTHDGIRFAIGNPDATLTVDGKPEGFASAYKEKELRLRSPGVHDVTIRSGSKKVELRVLAAPSVAETATIDEYLR